MKKNYDAWKISVFDFKNQKTDYEKLLFFLNFGILAPSSHNSQPWEFKLDEKKLSIYVFKSKIRSLPTGDPNNDLGYISIGCTIENIITAADYFGYSTHITYEESTDTDLCATLQFTQDHEQILDNKHLVHQISKRVVNRGKYESKNPNDDFLKKIKQLSTENYKIILIQDPKDISPVAEIVNDASIKLMDSPLFRKELSNHVKNNFTKSFVGIPAFGMQIPNILSFFAPTLVRLLNMDKLNKKQNMSLFTKYTPLVVVLISKKDSKKDKLTIGRLYQLISLYAISENIKTSPWGAVSVHEESKQKLQKILQTEFYPEFLFRMGYNNKDPHHSPRLLVDSVLKK
jgi:hypothetical protein